MGLLTAYDRSLLLFPFQPDAPMTEVLEWKTDIVNSHNGTESRYRVRNAPRQLFSFSHPIPPQLNSLANNVAYAAAGTGKMAVPVWSEAQQVSDLPGSAETITVETDYRDFREGGWALLWENPQKWRAVEILSKTPTSLVLVSPIGLAFVAPWIVPLNFGRLDGSSERETSGFNTRSNLRLAAENNIVIESTAPESYLGAEIIYDDAWMSSNSIQETIQTNIDAIDFETGPVTQFSSWLFRRRDRPYRRILKGAQEVWEFKEWLHRRAGRFSPFWLPTFENDLYLDMPTGPVGDSLLFRLDEYDELAEDRNHIAVQVKGGDWYPRTITEVTGSGAFRTAVLDSALIGVNSEDILRVSFLGLHRLNVDRVQFRWSGAGVCICEVRILEISP